MNRIRNWDVSGGSMAKKRERWLYLQWLGRVSLLAARGTTNWAFNWGPIVGSGVIGVLASAAGVRVIFPDGWLGIAVSTIVCAAAAWLAFFLFRLLLVAPFQLWRSARRPPAREKLQSFYVEAGAILERLSKPLSSRTGAVRADNLAAERFTQEVAGWIEANLGAATKARFLDLGSEGGESDASEWKLKLRRKNLERLVESDHWQ
jgi:hypothetical protein